MLHQASPADIRYEVSFAIHTWCEFGTLLQVGGGSFRTLCVPLECLRRCQL